MFSENLTELLTLLLTRDASMLSNGRNEWPNVSAYVSSARFFCLSDVRIMPIDKRPTTKRLRRNTTKRNATRKTFDEHKVIEAGVADIHYRETSRGRFVRQENHWVCAVFNAEFLSDGNEQSVVKKRYTNADEYFLFS